MRFKLKHRARSRLLGRVVWLNWAQGRPSSVSVKLGPWSWNSRKRGRVRTDLPGGFHSELDLRREQRR